MGDHPVNDWAGEYKKWDAKSQEILAARLEKALRQPPQAWYCDRGRSCDGKPHEGFPYKHARGDQWPPKGNDWFAWVLRSGRGAGKTTTGSNWVRKMSEKVARQALVGRRGTDVRGTMVEGPAGLIKICERAGVSYEWSPSKKEFTFANGGKALGYSAEEPDSLRGPEHGSAWMDEPAHMPLIKDVWDNLLFGLRTPDLPGGAKVLLTSTPLPLKWLKELEKEPTTVVVRVSSDVNIENLDPQFRRNVLDKHRGTRLGRQEINGEILEDVVGALWIAEMIEDNRVEVSYEDMERIVIGIDPSGTESKLRDETGIVVVGIMGDHLYVFDDLSGHYSPDGWAKAAWDAFDRYEADAIVAEKNYGGDMVRSVLLNARKDQGHSSTSDGSVQLVHSRRGKRLRAEPISGLYEQKRVHHVKPLLELEDQMLNWVPGVGDSPDRVDALVHAGTALNKEPVGQATIAIPGGSSPQPQQHSSLWTPYGVRGVVPSQLWTP